MTVERQPAVTESRSIEETERLAADLARSFTGGETVLLYGELGAGKTAFVRGLAQGLGADPEGVVSPTFVLLTTYEGRLALHHADLYRLSGRGDERELGLEELPGPREVLAIEWAERLGDAQRDEAIHVRLEHAGERTRRITIERGPA